jgi:G3E family GTPase
MIAAANPDARILDIAGDCLDPQAFLVPRLDPVSLASLTVRDHAHPLPIHTAALRFETRPSWSALAAALDGALRRAGRDVLRVKGIVGVAERDAPIVIDAVQTVFHPPLPLRSWPGESRSSRIVAIGRSETVSRLLDDVAASLGIGGEAPSEGPR